MDGELTEIKTLEYKNNTYHLNDKGPAPQQINPGEITGETHSGVLLPDKACDIRQEIENVLSDVVGKDHGKVTINRNGTVTIPWPTRGNIPLSEYSTQHFFTLAFPTLFPYGTGDFHINRPRSCKSMSDWAEHLLWFEDGRFAKHPYFKFIVHNMIMRRRAQESSNFLIQQKLGEDQLLLSDLKEQINLGDNSVGKKISYFGASLRGTSQYWSIELKLLSQYQINEFFTTGSCAEFHFKPLKRLLGIYIKQSTGQDIDLDDRATLFTLDLRTKSYFSSVMGPLFGVDTYWYRQEFAMSRGMVFVGDLIISHIIYYTKL